MSDGHAVHLAHQFETPAQQYEAATLGMWVFLITEIMLFGGLFTGYTFMRVAYPAAFAAASTHNNVVIGTVNTVVLIVSSLTMALAVDRAREARTRAVLGFLAGTAALGLVFLGLKGVEYAEHWQHGLVPGLRYHYEGPEPRAAALLFWLYFVMTGLHALHMVVGIALVAVLMLMAWRGAFTHAYHTPVEMTGLYWHLVDVIWVFLFPLLYLIGLHRSG